MWYFAWILGVTMAVLLASISAMMCDAIDCVLVEVRYMNANDARQG